MPKSAVDRLMQRYADNPEGMKKYFADQGFPLVDVQRVVPACCEFHAQGGVSSGVGINPTSCRALDEPGEGQQ